MTGTSLAVQAARSHARRRALEECWRRTPRRDARADEARDSGRRPPVPALTLAGSSGSEASHARIGNDASRVRRSRLDGEPERASTAPASARAAAPPKGMKPLGFDSCASASLVSIPCNRGTRLGPIGESPNIVVTIAALGDPCLQS